MFKVKEGILVGDKIITGTGSNTEVLTRNDVGTMAFVDTASVAISALTLTTLKLDDTDSGNNLQIVSTSTLSADRQLVFDVDDATRILRMTGNAVLSGTNSGDQTISFGTTGLTPSTATGGNVTVAGTLIPSNGGTGLNSVTTVGELYYGNTGSAMGRIASVAAGNYLKSNGVGASPVWAAIPAVNSGALSLTIGTAGATNTSVTIGTGTGFNADSASLVTYSIRVGPAISALTTVMTGASVGYIKKTAADSYTLDNFSYGTGLGANTLVQRDGSNNFSAGTITAALTGTASNATNLGGYARRVDLADFTTWDGTKVGPVGWYNITTGPAGAGDLYYSGIRLGMVDTNYGSEILIQNATDVIRFRRRAGGVYTAWQELIHDGNLTAKTTNLTVANANNATLATKASTVSQGGGNNTAMTLTYSLIAGTPTRVFGTTDGVTWNAYSPANFAVNTATSATTAGTVTTAAQPSITSVGTLNGLNLGNGAGDGPELNFLSSGYSTWAVDNANGTFRFMNSTVPGSVAVSIAPSSGAMVLAGTLTVGSGATESWINMGDSDQGTRAIHCNSERIGFMTQAGGWGAWCDDAGNWQVAGTVYGNLDGWAKLYYKHNVINTGATNFGTAAGSHYFVWSASSNCQLHGANVGDVVHFTAYATGWTITPQAGASIMGDTSAMIVNVGGPTSKMKTFSMVFIEAGSNSGWVVR